MLDLYRRALSRFDRPALEHAWQKVAAENEYCMWPKLPHIVRACEQFERDAAAKSNGDWVERATALADAYTRRFMLASQAAVRARESGYEQALKSYVREAAWVQAQYIVGQKGVGYSWAVLFEHRGGERDKEAEGEFFERAREQALKGHIRVHVPAVMVERWKGQVVSGRGR